jgi:hypothetical protein
VSFYAPAKKKIDKKSYAFIRKGASETGLKKDWKILKNNLLNKRKFVK